MSYLKNKPVVYFFKPVEPTSKNPVYFRSPAGEVKIDQMGYVKGVDIGIKREKDRYTIEVKLPVSFFKNLKLKNGLTLAVDFALNFSDMSGRMNVLKIYWNAGMGDIVSDVPTEQKIYPWRWGTAIFINGKNK